MPVLETKQSQINYTETGTGEPVVLVHCSSASGSEWKRLCEELGEKSPGPSRLIVEMLKEAMPTARVTEIDGAGHNSPLTHAEAVNRAIAAHLQSLARKQLGIQPHDTQPTCNYTVCPRIGLITDIADGHKALGGWVLAAGCGCG